MWWHVLILFLFLPFLEGHMTCARQWKDRTGQLCVCTRVVCVCVCACMCVCVVKRLTRILDYISANNEFQHKMVTQLLRVKATKIVTCKKKET